ncbi:prolyl-tRNA synthetase associated domain-containing protein [Aeromonas piscicola]|uniref:Prolyl-tRNA synthetase associated domain-containing protein n=1 Tax=Aeromonas piscicola TaxID=600645 RepID=A0ABT7QBN8_9GAMM|nr:prolyl-tRNA synthetase associated domain-containing protein [Aeromonas piscicola]MDM5131368.1 prolyl-tRNA synthetase associated domain-containing protein [Aeromonas piscicola]
MTLYSLLDRLAISYQRINHAPVFTCEEASKLLPDLPAARTKNLFLRDPRSERLFLVVAPEQSRVDLKALATALGVKRLSFGSPERLVAVLGLTPGAVTLLAMVRDTERAVTLVVDQTIWHAEQVQCHPLVNTATLIMYAACWPTWAGRPPSWRCQCNQPDTPQMGGVIDKLRLGRLMNRVSSSYRSGCGQDRDPAVQAIDNGLDSCCDPALSW